MKKYEFDNEPQLLEQEGSTMRINFDVEQAIVPIQSMSGEQAGERTIYKAAVVRVPIPMKAERIVAAVIAAGGDMLKANVVAAEALFADSGCSDLTLAKNFKTAMINEYDKSTAVNEFFLNAAQSGVDAAEGYQLAVGTLLGDRSVLEDDDLLSASYRRKAVGNDDQRLLLASRVKILDRPLDLIFRLGVDG